ncbi:MAG TPA: hypothetical protein VNT55_16785 [Baekduia sp.]|nr:hypothetical protein [Baekduia sp.]
MLDALAAPCEPSLRARLGADRDDALRAAMRDHARAWARAAGGGAEPLEVAAVAELAAALAGISGPVVLIAPDVPALGDSHLAAIHDDLAAGVLLSSAATGDGTPFLIALSATTPDLLATAGATFNDVLAIAATRGRELGMLRAERRLSTIGDAHALLADPLTRPELRALLAPLATG